MLHTEETKTNSANAQSTSHIEEVLSNTMGSSGYEPKEIEAAITQFWESHNYYKPNGKSESYCIMQPPPNVTGSLHMGHGFQTALMDALIRYHRMMGLNTLWQPGLDHAGIATQMVVTNLLQQQGIDPNKLSREEFLGKIWEWKEKSGGTIVSQFHRLGASADWDRARFTMDDDYYKAVQTAFIRLFDKGLIYKGPRLVNWDPVLHTALSDLEVTATEEVGSLWYFKYPLADNPSEFVCIATTRPETMLGDTAVAVNPKDERYQHLIGKKVMLPIVNREIPVVADDMVDPNFGSGVVKITPAHDANDLAVSKRHQLPVINIMTEDACLNDEVPLAYQNLDRFEAREKVVKEMEQLGLLDRIEKHVHKIPRGERSGVVIEPRLTNQWFVKTEELARPAMDVVRNGQIKFVPETWSNTYFHWMENIEEWCISRQLVWGHRIPAWYDEAGNIYAGLDEKSIREKYSLAADISLKQDGDVLDTWFSSAIWPFATLGWPNNSSPDLSSFYPNSVLVTGHDIIFFWVARMIMFGLEFANNIPFKEVYITGLVCDQFGQKMSKSKGNVLDPIDLIDGIPLQPLLEKRTAGLMLASKAAEIEAKTRVEFPQGIPAYGTDAVRFTFNISSSPGANVNFSVQQVEATKHFCNKIWNSTKYVLQQMQKIGIERIMSGEEISRAQLSTIDRWILSRLNKIIHASHEHYRTYRTDLLAKELMEFFKGEFCDWYLEFSKKIIQTTADRSELIKHASVLLFTLETMLKTLHPMMPFITEALWQKVKPFMGVTQETIMLQAYPSANDYASDSVAENEIEWLKNFISTVRSARESKHIPTGKFIPVELESESGHSRDLITRYSDMIKSFAKISEVQWLAASESNHSSTSITIGDLRIHMPEVKMTQRERDQEASKLSLEIDGVKDRLAKSEQQLSIAGQSKKGKTSIVKVEAKIASLKEKLSTLNDRLNGLMAMEFASGDKPSVVNVSMFTPERAHPATGQPGSQLDRSPINNF